jgi:WS/DGAT/MGAT family acyltransferase
MSTTAPEGLFDRLTASDRFLMWDDYGWSSDIGALAIVDGARLLDADGHVLTDVVREHLEPRLNLVPRFRQLLDRPKLGLGWPLWVDASDFDLAHHVQVRQLPRECDEEQLFAVAEELLQRPFDPTKPLWELWLLPGLPDRRVAVVLKAHHVVADGTAALAAFASLLDITRDAPPPKASAWTPRARPAKLELLRDNLRRRRSELRCGLSGLLRPTRTLRQARAALPAWREVLTDKPAPRTTLNHPVSGHRRLAVIRGRLGPVIDVAHDNDAKVNDVILAAVAGGLRRLLARRGELVEGLTQRAMVTIVEQHAPDEGTHGNKPGWIMVPLPLDDADDIRRVRTIAAETTARKQRARPEVGSGPFRFWAAQRLWYRLFPRQRAVNIVVSNVAGPPVPLYLAGAELLELIPLMPTMGNLTLVVAAVSYNGQLNIGAVGDRDHCADLDEFADGVRASLAALAERLEEVPT